MLNADAFDEGYYDTFYLRRQQRARAVAQAGRTADLIHGMARHYGIQIRRFVDLGAGTGYLLRALQKRFPGAAAVGVEYSAWAAKHYGWIEGSLLDFEDARGFDLVVCNDVLQYLDDASAARALERIAALSRAMAYVTALTAHDLEHTCDPDVSDTRGHFRSGAWYRRRLGRAFIDVGSGVQLQRSARPAVWELERR